MATKAKKSSRSTRSKSKSKKSGPQNLLKSRRLSFFVFIMTFVLVGGVYLIKQSSAYGLDPTAASCSRVTGSPSSAYAGERSWDFIMSKNLNQSTTSGLRYKYKVQKQGRLSAFTTNSRNQNRRLNLNAGPGNYNITGSVIDRAKNSEHFCAPVTVRVTQPATCSQLSGGANGPGSRNWDFALSYNRNDAIQSSLRFRYVVKRGNETIYNQTTASNNRRITFPNGAGTYRVTATVSDRFATTNPVIARQASCSKLVEY